MKNSCPFSQPNFFVVKSEEEGSARNVLCLMSLNDIGFPVMCKPVEACGTPNSHRMVRESLFYFLIIILFVVVIVAVVAITVSII